MKLLEPCKVSERTIAVLRSYLPGGVWRYDSRRLWWYNNLMSLRVSKVVCMHDDEEALVPTRWRCSCVVSGDVLATSYNLKQMCTEVIEAFNTSSIGDYVRRGLGLDKPVNNE